MERPTSLDAERELKRLADAVETLNNHRFVRIQNSPMRMVGFQFMRGLAFGLGTVIGASALVSLLVLFLSQVEVVPYIGDLATRIIQEINVER